VLGIVLLYIPVSVSCELYLDNAALRSELLCQSCFIYIDLSVGLIQFLAGNDHGSEAEK
jgi:hypothetical protein